MHSKMISKEEFKEKLRPEFAREKKTVALCHGVFDLVHPGHIIHLQQAKEMADILVVSITSSKYVRKGPGRPYFDDAARMNVLAAIECIDYVLLSESYTADDMIESVEPDLYVKGAEYEKEEDDLTGKIAQERELVERHGGKIAFTGGQVFSSTKLINTAMSGLPEEVVRYMREFKKKHTMREVRDYAEKAGDLRVLVIGDLIIDKYSYCNIQGLMSKDMGYSARMFYSEEYLGGSAAIARHLSTFTKQVTLMSVIGDEENRRLLVFDELSDKMQLKLSYSHKFPTIVKHRYLSRNQKREEYKKVFVVNNIPEKMEYEKEVHQSFKDRLREEIGTYDAVFLCDFGHGLIDREMIDIVQNGANYLALNCQTNSTNKGLNVITKYTRADVFSLDQQELKLAFPELALDEMEGLSRLSGHLRGSGWLTRGSAGAYGIGSGQIQESPAFTLNVKDTIGAGDAFFAVAGIFAAAGAPVDMSTFAGNIGGALGANIIGNKEDVEKINVLKFANTLMNI